MTTQTVKVVCFTREQVNVFTGTATDDAWNNIKDAVDTSSQLGDVLLGKTVTHISSQYAGGGGLGRIRDTASKKILAMFPLSLVAGERKQALPRPVTVTKTMVIDVFSVAVPS